jgi:hypothetical protein
VSTLEVIDRYVAALPGETRRLAHAEWGVTVAAEQAGGAPLDVGPDRIGDRAPLQELRGQTAIPT